MSEAGKSDVDSLPYLGLSYATGPSHSTFYKLVNGEEGGRNDPIPIVEDDNVQMKDKMCSAGVPMKEGVNGGEDVIGMCS